MNITQRTDGWWIESPAIDGGAAGPYQTKKEAAEDRRGLATFFREHPAYRADRPTTKPAPEDEPFALQPVAAPAPRAKPEGFYSQPTRQKSLFTGLDCLPGQLDLFNTDGGWTK